MKPILIVVLLFSTLLGYSQEKDFGIWTSGTFQYKYSKKLDFAVTPELRWDRNVTRWRTRLIDFKTKYEFSEGWSAIGVVRIGGHNAIGGGKGVHVFSWESIIKESGTILFFL